MVQNHEILDVDYPVDFNFDDELLNTFWELRYVSLFAVKQKLNVFMGLYKEDKNEYNKKRAILLLMQFWAIRTIMQLTKMWGLPERECWHNVLDEHSKRSWLMERVRKMALSSFKIGSDRH